MSTQSFQFNFINVYLSFYLYLSIYLLKYLSSVHAQSFLSNFINVYLSFYLSVKISAQCSYTTLPFQLYKCLSIFLSLIIIYLFIFENICPVNTHNPFYPTLSIYLSFYPYYLSIYLSLNLYISKSIYL